MGVECVGFGMEAGTDFFGHEFRPEGLLWLVLVEALTIFPVMIMAFISIFLLKMDYGTVSGMLGGSMANPMALNYANSTVAGDSPAVSYATVYPLSMFIRVILAQLILMLFL